MKRTSVSVLISAMLCLALTAGCSKKDKDTEGEASAHETPTVSTEHVSENDQYMQKLEQDIDIVDPDSLIEDVNKQVGDNQANAELARRNAVSGSAVVEAAAPAPVEPAPAP
ncbi:MAG: hypothetical protein RL180_237 [Pseudomonadota bacterium]|jgi:hypothetical protein